MLNFKNKIIAVDFDGTCVKHEFPSVGEDVPYAVTTLKRLTMAGAKIILYTMRSNCKITIVNNNVHDIIQKEGNYLDDAVDWFKSKNIPLFGINENPEQNTWTSSPKPYAHYYIDDSALGCPLIVSDNKVYVDWLSVWEKLTNIVKPKIGKL